MFVVMHPFFCLLNKLKMRFVNCCTRRFGIACKISMHISFLQLAPILLYISSADQRSCTVHILTFLWLGCAANEKQGQEYWHV